MDLMPEASSAPPNARQRYIQRSLTAGSLFLLLYLGSHWAESQGMVRPLIMAMGYGGIVALLWMLYEFVHLVRQLDELQQRIHIMALAVGFGSVALLITIVGMSAGFSGGWLPVNVVAKFAALALPAGIIAYYVSVHLVKRRYE